MPNPTLRNGIFSIRVRVPADVIAKAKGTLVQIPVGDSTTFVKVTTHAMCSLRTRDPNEGRIRYAEALAAFEKHWEYLRQEVTELNFKQRLALAGEIRADWIEAFDAEPGFPESWDQVARLDTLAKLGVKHELAIPTGDAQSVLQEMEARFGGLTDVALQRHGLRISNRSRIALLGDIANAMSEAATVNRAKATGDYTDSGETTKYPAYESAFPNRRPASQPALTTTKATERPSSTTLTEILEKRIAEKAAGREAKPMSATMISKCRTLIAEFDAFRQDTKTSSITPEIIDGWKRHMLAEGKKSNNTIKQRLTNLKTLLGYGIKQSFGKLFPEGNPANLVELPQAEAIPSDQKTYKISEARIVLKATRNRSLGDETRWLPWLCAYSGARVSEPAQLKAKDVYQIEGRWFMRLTTMGERTLKNLHGERRVPLHHDVIEEGFLEFVAHKRSLGPDTPLFGAKHPGAKVRDWVRRTLKIERDHLKANHGWRHLFEDIATASGMQDSAKTYITGRSQGKSSEGYGKSEALLIGLAEQMDRIPSYL